MKKNKQYENLKSLMQSQFTFGDDSDNPENQAYNAFLNKSKQLLGKVTDVVNENNALKRELNELDAENENLDYQVQHSERKVDMLLNLLEVTNKKMQNVTLKKQETDKLKEEISEWNEKYQSLSNQFDDAVEQLHEAKQKLSKQSTRNLNKKIKRKEETIQSKKMQLNAKTNEIMELREESEKQKEQIDSLKQDKRNLLVKVCRLKKGNETEKYECRIEELKNEIKMKQKEISELEETNALLNDPILETFYDGKYSNEIRETIMCLVTECGVSQKKVNSVLQIVVQNLTGKTLSRLPSTGVKSRLLLEAKRVANYQVATSILEDGNNTLHQDGTTKFHRHFQGFQFTTTSGKTLSAGISEVAGGDAETLMQEFKDLVDELAQSLSNKTADTQKTCAEIIASIRSTMSDQCSVNPLFNKKLLALKEELAPVVFENWNNLSEEEKKQTTSLFSFFCKMHLFVNMATEVDKCLALFEKSVVMEGKNPYSFNSGESGCSRLIRTASKALTKHGCERSGVASHFNTYMKSKGIQNRLSTFRGHRFNHLFHSAGTTFYHINDIKEFLQRWASPNDLLNSVAFDADEAVYVCGVRALGLIDKLITGPLWRLIEAAPNVLALNKHLLQLKLTLEAWSKDGSSALSGDCAFSEDDVNVTKDCIYDILTAPAENPIHDTYTQMAFEICCSGMLLILERQAKDQLPGGKYWTLDDPISANLQGVPTTNTASERDFAQLDILMRSKPSASTTTYEAIVMWSNNKTSGWLNSLPETEKQNILENARKNAPEMMKSVKEKQRQLYQNKLNILRDKQEKKEKKETKQHENKIRLTQQLTEIGGLWTDVHYIERFKSSNSETDFKTAVVCQIQFHKSVLNSSGPRELFQLQSKGKQFSITELEENLKKILELNQVLEIQPNTENKLKYTPVPEMSDSVTSLKKTLMSKIEQNRQKITISQQKELLPMYLDNPEKLVGRKIKHKCREEGSDTVEWVYGVVCRIKTRPTSVKKTEFYVKYEGDDDDWFFPLLQDLAKGDLIVVE